MQQIYINGIKATQKDLDLLYKRVEEGKDYIIETHTTKNNNIAIVTA